LGGAPESLAVRRSSAEQSNSSILYDERLVLKLFRRWQPGLNPDHEIGKYLTEQASFDRVPPFAGAIQYESKGAETATLGVLQGFIANEGDGWKWTIEEIERYYENCATVPFPENAPDDRLDLMELSEQATSPLARDHVGIYLDAAATLGRRTAELHRALALPSSDPLFCPEPLNAQDLQALEGEWREEAVHAFDLLKDSVAELPDEVVEPAALVLARRRTILDRLRVPASESGYGQRIRIHGDLHLGQVLRVKTDYIFLDFEGEPARPLAERRTKQSPLKDVAGMLRSFSYAAISTLMNYAARHAEDFARLEPWARLWERSAAAEFLRAYRDTAGNAVFLPLEPKEFRRLLACYWLDKALYELLYELNNRPAWVRIPLLGLSSPPL
jgi:maltose alpha-D-glucosyltransferase/alpha-amylase